MVSHSFTDPSLLTFFVKRRSTVDGLLVGYTYTSSTPSLERIIFMNYVNPLCYTRFKREKEKVKIHDILLKFTSFYFLDTNPYIQMSGG